MKKEETNKLRKTLEALESEILTQLFTAAVKMQGEEVGRDLGWVVELRNAVCSIVSEALEGGHLSDEEAELIVDATAKASAGVVEAAKGVPEGEPLQ